MEKTLSHNKCNNKTYIVEITKQENFAGGLSL
jgi:hypothetical protein